MQLITTVLAQGADTPISLTPPDAPNFTIESLIGWAVTAVLVIAGLIFFFMLILGGLRWILSGGDKASTEGARNQITAALVGLIIVFSAWAIASLMNAVFGVDILNFTIPTIPEGPTEGS
ncbi:hypothetical protein C4564_04755 [Candidatus Microgenomates bacterium]|nr:MAG: hypothetical protein C4564_04755 [Candidatus Microgenomates bacterium]